MNTRATQLTILQMIGNAVTMLSESPESASTMAQMILTAEESTLEARWEESERLPDREMQLAALINAAANCIRAAATLVDKIDPVDFASMQIQLIKTEPAKPQPSVSMPPVHDFVEEQHSTRN